jgi:hypothetical protein
VIDAWDPEDDPRPPTITVGKTAYMINAEHYDRISAVIDVISKPGLDKWKRQKGFAEADRIMKESAWLGTRVHAICENYCKGVEYWPGFWLEQRDKEPVWVQVQGTELEPYCHGYLAWHRDHIRSTILLETTVWSRTHGFAGTFDHFAELTDLAVDEVNAELEKQKLEPSVPYGCLALLDNKTSGYLSWTYRLQTAAYVGSLLEQQLLPCVDLRGIVHMSSKKPGTCRLVPYPPETQERDWGVWLGVLDTYRMAQQYEDDWKR